MYSLMLITVLVIMGGAIAYIGDKLGSKVGKKKMTIFGLRPKYTSILVTIVTGIIIAASTLGVMTMVSLNVRTALFGMEALKQQLTTLSKDVASSSVALEFSKTALAAKTKEYNTLTAKINITAAELARVAQELDVVSAERDRTATALNKVQSEFALARGNLDQAQQEIHSLQAKKDQLDVHVAALNDEKTKLQTDVDQLIAVTINLRKGVLVYRAGEALSTATIKGGRPPEETEAALATMITTTNQAILTNLKVTDKSKAVLWITKADVAQATKLISAASDEVVVRIISQGNMIYGEPVIGHLELYPNRRIYTSGQMVYSQVVDVGTSTKGAEDAVLDFLKKVNAHALSQGILPVDPLVGTVGDVDGFRLLDAINKVKSFGGKVELSACAKNDIYTVGPLQIAIKVHGMQ